jgi:hypothetical protein
MATDVYNVWDQVYGIMCIPCKHCDYCHGVEDESNDAQMVECMFMRQIIRVPDQKIKREDIFDPLGVIDEVE